MKQWLYRFLWISMAGSMVLAGSALSGPVEKGIASMTEFFKTPSADSDPHSCAFSEDDAELQKNLSPEQYRILRKNGTELPFKNAYWNQHEPGIYVDPVSGAPLFSSLDKFDSGSGWPSFKAPIRPDSVVEKNDLSTGMLRKEVRSQKSNSHLGHVFDDGPKPSGLRYCINSAALRFIPAENLEREGYGKYASLFTPAAAGWNPAEDFPTPDRRRFAVFGAGCFWGVESAFLQVPGVLKTAAGYMGGSTQKPAYEQVCTGRTGHAEVVRVEFNPAVVPYEKLLNVFWSIHDPTTVNRQGPDIGTQYRSVIFTTTPEQLEAAKRSRSELSRSGKLKSEVVTEILPAGTFYKAEDYHQRYFEKKGLRPFCHLPK
ncbi:MAG: bifunctional methionine sulfoxide reductase B/A protein [Candidatus Omnitrophota bacterium]|jgi:peptide methionine sulfoxide reductase msrA/msrB